MGVLLSIFTEPKEKEAINETNYIENDNKNNVVDIEEKEETEKTEQEKKLSGFELVSIKGHPVLYDNLSEAHEFWDKYADGRIDFADNYKDDYESDRTVLIVDAYTSIENTKEHMIRGFEIYPDKEISLEEGLELTKSYIPMEILQKWYELKISDCYYWEKDNECMYSILYTPTESGAEEIKRQEKEYNYFHVLIYTENDIVTGITINSTFNTPNTGSDYEMKDWSYDFLSE